MKPDGLIDNYYFGGGGDTLLSPLAIVLFVVAVTLILLLPRKYVVIPLLAAGLLIPLQLQVVVGGLHFMIYRLLFLAGWVRILWERFSRGKAILPGAMTALDKYIVLWGLCNAIVFTILWGAAGALVNRLGFLFTTFGTYFLLRSLIRGREDVIRTIRTLAVLAAVLAVPMLVEHFTGRNPFSVLGGVPVESVVREGRIRAGGPFAHPIIAGTVGAVLLPLFIGLWWQGKQNRWVAAIGIAASTLITAVAASSTPLMVYAAGVLGLCLWPLRRYMRVFRWALVLSILGLHIVMKAPVWYLLQRVGEATGGSGWHRAALIDMFIRRFGDWWLIGTRNNAYWGYDMWDAINGYVSAGLGGGLITLARSLRY